MTHIHQPDLADNFLQPKGWRWHSFKRGNREIRFGSVFPQDSVPDAVIVCLQGLREFSEKYYETAHWALENNCAFWMMDWAGQGKSTRFLQNEQKRHSTGFDEDIADLRYFIMEYIKHASVHPDKGRIPMAMLGHSMGANIGLRYLSQYPDTFECAAFTSPMIGIKIFKHIPQQLALSATGFFNMLMKKSYVFGGTDWGKRQDHARLSFDPVRKEIHGIWCNFDEELQTGDATFRWIHEAQKSCIALQKCAPETPFIIGIAEHEDLVDNDMAKKFANRAPQGKLIRLSGAAHEILMEKNDIRDAFLNEFYKLIEENIINRPESLKPF